MEVQNLNEGRESVRVMLTADDLKELKANEAKPAADGNLNVQPQGEPSGQPAGERSGEGGEKPQRPEWVPEEYWDAEKGVADFERMARELAEKNAKPADDKPKDDDGGDKRPSVNAYEVATLREKADKELLEGGKLSEETYKGFEAIGFPREQVDLHMAGIAALSELARRDSYEEVGGKEQYEQMIAWARTALTTEEIAAYDRAVNGLDRAVMLNAVRGLHARFRVENGKEGALVRTASPGGSGGDLFESKRQLVDAMRDPRYQKDEAYRAAVQAKMERSLLAGKNLGI